MFLLRGVNLCGGIIGKVMVLGLIIGGHQTTSCGADLEMDGGDKYQ